MWLIFPASRNPIVNKLLHSFVILSVSEGSALRKGLSRCIGIHSTAFSLSPLVRFSAWGRLTAESPGPTGAGRYTWCRIAMSFPPRITVRGGNLINLVSTLLRLRPQLLIKLSIRYRTVFIHVKTACQNGKVLPARPATSPSDNARS